MGWAVAIVVATIGVLRLDVDTSTDSVLDRRDDAWKFYQRSIAAFGGDETLVVALEGDGPFDPEMLGAVETITAELEETQGVRRVDSLSTVPIIEVGPDQTLRLEPALDRAAPFDRKFAGEVARRLQYDRIAPHSLISVDGRVAGINVLLEPDLGVRFEEVVHEVRKVVEDHAAWVSGVPVFRTEINTRTGAEIAFFSALTVLLVGSLLRLATGSWVGVVLPVFASAAGSWVLLGAMGMAGTPITLSTMILPSIMLALGSAYSLHVLASSAGAETEAQLTEAVDAVALPVSLSGLTTAIGFVAISSMRITALQEVGGYGALGVLAVLLATLTAVPAGLRLFPLPKRRNPIERWIGGSLHGFLMRRATHPVPVFIVWLVVTGVSIGGLSRLELETDATRWFARGSEVRESYERIRQRLSGISPMNVVVRSLDGTPVTEPSALASISSLADSLSQLDVVGKAISVADPLRQMHGGFIGDVSQPLPQSRALSEQYLLLLDSVEQMRDLVTIDRREANILLRVDNNGSRHLLGIAEAVEQWWKENGPRGFDARATGIMYEFARAQDEISEGQIRGLAAALGCIAGLLFLMFRSVRIALIAIVPNALPIAIAFGFMGLIRVPLDAGTVLVGSLALGVAVDDTIHVVSGFSELRRRSASARDALAAALRRVLPALFYTTIAVGLGFAVLGFSEFAFTRNLGLLTAGVMVVCFAADVLLLPALLLAFDKAGKG